MKTKTPKAITLEQIPQPGCEELLEVVLFAPQGAHEYDFHLGADVRFGTMVLSSEDWSQSVEIGLSRATLGLATKGCEIDPSSSRFGDKKPHAVRTQLQRTLERMSELHAGAQSAFGAKASTNNMSASADTTIGIDGKIDRNTKMASTETLTSDSQQEPVLAMPGNRWQFSATSDNYMQSRYCGDESLCKMTVTAPTITITGTLAFQPKDIVIVDLEAPQTIFDRLKRSPNKIAIARLLLARHLREINQIPEKTASSSIIGWISTLTGRLSSDK
ncbi:hypothetical protein BJ123_105110 [Rhodopseudomonas thermotolerans]|uniref:Uncharacterized protein n=2 Tax=Rhodopseudomonas TaxID=1073 RepID=A0A336JNS4_9BRAD|nr:MULTISPECIES: hypothetical protein [Rhodopseudomonas]RED38031.1 hypothetical protein BJ125_105110 [Rhodopseudomonas pentothenatexigens]REG05224.1 hypothetical protein BJ123_105110 [Rhodopseudomonas thermotolerans]SSW90056.1 hypothetical protein SAMN05892882_105110 [Rhodopseudomonas pentothenatexigens]